MSEQDGLSASIPVGQPAGTLGGAVLSMRAWLHALIRREWVLLAGILLVALGLRLYLLLVKLPAIGSDEAIIGLMACHILQGERPLLYYGQSYYGPLDAYLSGPVFVLFGQTDFTLRIVPLIASLSFVATIYQLGKALYSPRVGLWSAVYAALPPAFLAVRGIKADAAYSLILLAGTLALLLFHNLLVHFSWKKLGGLVGLCILGLWIFPLMAYSIAAMGLVGVLIVLQQRKNHPLVFPFKFAHPRLLPWMALLAAAALLVAWGWLDAARLQNFWTGMTRLYSIAFPILLGLLPPVEYFPYFEQMTANIPPVWMGLIVLCAVLVLGGGIYSGWLRFRQGNGLLFVFFSVTLLIFILFFSLINIRPAIFSFPRYLFPLYGTIPLWVDALLHLTARRRIVCLAGGATILAINLISNLLLPSALAPAPELLAWSESQVETQYVYTSYWIGYWLAFESHEKVIPFILEGNQPGNNRWAPFAQQVLLADQPVYAYTLGSAEEKAFVGFLERYKIGYQVDSMGAYQIFHHLTHPIQFSLQGMVAR